MARILYTDGRVESIDSPGLTLDRMQAIVGGYIEIVYLDGPPPRPRLAVLVVNEDGHTLGLALNVQATSVYRAALVRRGHAPGPREVIVGDAIECLIADGGEATERFV